LNPYIAWALVGAGLTLGASAAVWFSVPSLDGVQSYLIAVNVVAFCLYGYDKLAAQRGWPRIPERILVAFVLALGVAGAEAGRRLFHHKTTDVGFRKMYWGAVLLEVALILAFAAATNRDWFR
jgi:uncharacterized membrane protein YsdA (DUF1294 family)